MSTLSQKAFGGSWFQCKGGPHHERTFNYNQPLPRVAVIATNPPLVFHQYRRENDTNTYRYIGVLREGK